MSHACERLIGIIHSFAFTHAQTEQWSLTEENLLKTSFRVEKGP